MHSVARLLPRCPSRVAVARVAVTAPARAVHVEARLAELGELCCLRTPGQISHCIRTPFLL